MKNLMGSIAAKTGAYILLVISGIISAVSGVGIYCAFVLRFYSMQYYRTDEKLLLGTET